MLASRGQTHDVSPFGTQARIMLTHAADNAYRISWMNLTTTLLTVGLFIHQNADIFLGEMETLCERKEMNTLVLAATMSKIAD